MLRKLILKTLYVLIICSILIFTSQCGFPRKSLSPDEVVNNSESLVGQNVTIRGIVQMSNFVTCTEEECSEDNPCCNSCTAELELTGKESRIAISGKDIGCSGDICSLTCEPMLVGNTYDVNGVLKGSPSNFYLEVENFTMVE